MYGVDFEGFDIRPASRSDDKASKKKRQDILYLLNNKDKYKGQDATLEKYEIKYEEATGK